MPAIERSLPIIGHLPDPIRDMLRRRAHELAGLGLIVLAAVLVVALASWSVADPSLSHATSRPTRNLIGYPGAIAADLMMQILGVGAAMVALPVAIWGLRMMTHHRFDREAVRIGCWILAIVTASGFASCFPQTQAWPLPTGLGGVVGDALLRVPAMVLGPLDVWARIVIGLLLASAMTASFLVATSAGARETDAPDDADLAGDAGDGADDDDDTGRQWISLGWLTHEMLSLKARAGRVLARTYRWLVASTDERPSGRFDRAEPTMGLRSAPAFEPHAPAVAESDPDDDIEDEDDEPVARAPRKRAAKPARSNGKFVLPPLSVLAAPRASERFTPSADAISENARMLEGVLQDFGVRGEVTNAHPGPVVTLYELEPAPGIKSSRVIGLADDIARSMSAISARVAVVAGRNAIGIELPNAHREKVYLRELLAAKDYNESVAKLPLCLGKTIGGDPVIVDLARMPHLLIAGTTGSGKSVAINTMILSLVYRLKPEQCRLIMVDPKMLELSVYDGIPHLLTPVVTDPKKAVVALKWAVREMEERYKKMAKLGVRNIDGYNNRLAEAKARGEELTRTVHTGFDKETGKAIYEEEALDLEPLPYIVVIVDEMADLMMVAGKDIEGAVQRLAQMARAAGLHVVLATQRPSVDVITGTIKANFPTRISFQVTSKIDSRTILGEQGAEQLLGQGDMLYMAGGGRISRVHGPFVSDDEVEKVVRHLKAQGVPQYLEAVTADDEEDGDAVFDATGMGGGDDLYSQAVQIVKRDRKASTSYIQRRLQIGYNRAATLMERMEEEGIVGQANHAGKREILIGED
jgi:S-DNA-T family DNA segregation ATPase FtsK/SpoIIIE